MVERRRALLEWRPRLPARARLALTLAVMLAAAGAVVISGIYTWLRLGVSYDFAAGNGNPQAAPETVAGRDGTVVAVRVATQQDFYDTLLVTSMAALAFITVLGAVVAWTAAGRMLKPLHLVTAAARRASRNDLDHRIGFVGPQDEISELADTFDHMLDRLERSFHAHRRFAANASHELQTPLATMQAILDVAETGAAEDQPELMKRLRETNRRSIEIVEKLLDLSDIDNAAVATDAIQLDRLTAEALEALRPFAAERGLTITENLAPSVAAGDEALLQRLLANLIDNAIAHNSPGGYILVTTSQDAQKAAVVVENSTDMPMSLDPDGLIEPFARQRGRAGRNGGHGLGLAIVQSIVAAHDGHLELTSRAEGRFVASVRVPGIDASSTQRRSQFSGWSEAPGA